MRRRARLRGPALRRHARTLQRRLAKAYPDARCELEHRNPFELAVATVLSAQCTDKRVNLVTPSLFRRWPDAAALATATRPELEAAIQSTGFFRNKAKSLHGLARRLVEEHGGVVPRTMEELTALPGVGRKTANVLLGNAFGINEGIVVDTHVARLSKRLGLSVAKTPERIERELVELFDRSTWTTLSHLLIQHGRRVCDARRPRCGDCVLSDLCPSSTA